MEAPGLRVRQRQKRRRRIVFSAAGLFEAKGYTETTMEEIAARAEISTPTIYNYFQSKSDILLGLLEVDKELMDEQLDQVIANPSADPVEALYKLVNVDLLGGYDIGQKKVWRLIAAASMEAGDDRRKDFLKAQNVFAMKIQKLVERLQAEGKIFAGVEARVVSRLVNSITRDAFRLYVHSEEASVDSMLRSVREQLVVLHRGLG